MNIRELGLLLPDRIERLFRPVRPELLSWRDLKPATLIPQEVLSDYEVLNTLYRLGKDITEGHFMALAFTQIPSEKFLEYGLDPRYTNCIYLSKQFFQSQRGRLLVNPECRFSSPSKASAEVCGSIFNANVHMVVLRPTMAQVNGIFFEPDFEPVKIDKYFHGVIAAVIDHEYRHIQGGSAFTTRELLLNIKQKQDWESVDGLYRNSKMPLKEVLIEAMNHGQCDWLVYEDDQFFVVTIRTPVQDLDAIEIIRQQVVPYPFQETSHHQS